MSLAFRDHWQHRVLPPEGSVTLMGLSVSHANRAMGILRKMYRDYFKHIGQSDRDNPFRNLSFPEKDRKRTRPPFTEAWIIGKFLAPGALARMNEQERCILLALIETGARPIELCSLVGADIVTNGPVPYIHIRPSDAPDNTHELKSVSSERDIPLVGVALELFRRFPDGFLRYRDNSNSFSATANKFLFENGLLETDRHTVYSLRHSFEDRMKSARIDTEIRIMLMGHKLDRPLYGVGGGLKLWHEELIPTAR